MLDVNPPVHRRDAARN